MEILLKKELRQVLKKVFDKVRSLKKVLKKRKFTQKKPLGIFWIPWTSRYHLNTLDLSVLFGYLGPRGTFWIPLGTSLTFSYPFFLHVPLGPLGTS